MAEMILNPYFGSKRAKAEIETFQAGAAFEFPATQPSV